MSQSLVLSSLFSLLLVGSTSSVYCPELNRFSANPQVITRDNLRDLRLSTYSREVGTLVRLSCVTEQLTLFPDNSQLECLSSGRWDKAVPACIDPSEEDLYRSGKDPAQNTCMSGKDTVPFILYVIMAEIIGLVVVIGVVYKIARKRIAVSRKGSNPPPVSRQVDRGTEDAERKDQ